ncbi:MAG: V4R domain-containing protein [Cyanobacteria bacterium J06632_22]
MLSVAELLSEGRIAANYFSSDVYVRGITELGLLENRRGDRLLALPQTLIKAIYAGLEQETGQAAMLVLSNCGRWWGKNFYSRFCEELNDYYRRPIADLSMAEFVQALQECWRTHGWGEIALDATYRPKGFLVIELKGSAFTADAPATNRPVCYVEAGVLQSFFSQLTGRDLYCVQTACESMGQDRNQFIIGLEKRLTSVEDWVDQGRSHTDIMEELVRAA